MTEKELTQYFPQLEKELIKEMIDVGEVKEFKRGEIIIKSGQYIRSALLVLEGLVKVYRENDEGGEFFMYYLEPGSACAISIVCAIGKETSELLAIAETDCRVLMIAPNQVSEWMSKYKSWAQFAISTYRERFEELLQVIDHVAFRNMDERLVFYLKRQQQQFKTNIVTRSFKDIAQDLNSSREVVSRLMKKLSEAGVVKLHGTHVELVNLDKALF